MFEGKLDELRRRMAEAGIDLALITDDDAVYYLTGYYDYLHLEFGRPTILAVPLDGPSVLLAPSLDAVIADRYQVSLDRYTEALSGARSLAGRLKRLTALRTEEGYMAELEKTAEGWLLVENHCPICAAAAHCQGFCSNELNLFQAVLGEDAEVARAEYLLAGGRRCAYRITRR